MKSSRTKNGFRNTTLNAFGYLFTIICGFVVRTFFIKTLSSEYLGINGLFTNLLSILSLAEMGIGTAIVYSLYKPLANNNENKVMELMNFYKRTYQIIAAVISGAGLLIMPFIYKLINDAPQIPESLYLIYLLYLINSVASYLFIYKRSLLVADQKEYLASIVGIFYNLFMSIIQILILVYTHDFLLFLVVQIIFGILQNIIVSILCDKKYPYIKKNDRFLPKEEKQRIFRNVKALLIYRVANLVTNSTDNLILSKFVGITAVGLYSNYYLIIHSLYMLIRHSLTALTASIGNLNTTKNVDKMRLVYNTTTFVASWLFGLAAIGLFVVIDKFIVFWAGANYLLSENVVLVLIINFYLMGVSGIYNVLRTTYGLFTQGMLRPIVSSIINLVASLIFVQYWGIVGVFVGTCVAFLSINIWFDPYIVYKHAFNKSVFGFYVKNVIYIILIIFAALLSKWVCSYINISSQLLDILVQGAIAMVISNLLFLASFYKTQEFKYLFGKVKSITKKK